MFKRKNHYDKLVTELRLYRDHCHRRIAMGDLDFDNVYYNGYEYSDKLLETLGANDE